MKKDKNMLRVAIYARRTVDSERSDSIQMQIETCRKHLELARAGRVASVTVYQDEGFTRRNVDRPDWQRMMQDIEAGVIDLVIAYKMDRISGNMRDFSLFYSRIVDDLELELIAVREGIDSSLPLIGEVMAYISALMATYEVKQDSIRSLDNSLNLAVHGFWSGGRPPIGYTLVPATIGGKTHKMLQIDPEGVAYKMQLVNIFLDNNLTLSGMERYLKNTGVKTRNGKFFSTSQIYQILTAPQCVAATPEIYDYFAGLGCKMSELSPRELWDGNHGLQVFGRTTERKGKHKCNAPEEWTVCLGLHEPFLSSDVYLRIREQLTGHTFQKMSVHPPELLKGALRCKCGNLMRVARKKRIDGTYSTWYFCHLRMRQGVEYCDVGHIKTGLLDSLVLDVFRDISAHPDSVDKYLQESVRSSGSDSQALRSREKSLEDKIGRLTASLALSSGSTAAKYIISEIERLDQELSGVRSSLARLAAEESRAAAARANASARRADICRFVSDFDGLSKYEQNEIVKKVLRSCVWDGETLRVTL